MITSEAYASTLQVQLSTASINPLSRLWQAELAKLIAQLESLPDSIRAIHIRFHRDTVLADYELPQLMTLTTAQAADCMALLGNYQQLLRRLEHLDKPVIALLGGHLSGHALGLALACQRRYALADSRYSLPQVTLGIMPCSGEVARIGRLAGYQAAMPLLLEGQPFGNAEALQLGMIHASAADSAGLTVLAEQHLAQGSPPRQPWDTPHYRVPGGAPDSRNNLRLLQMAPAMLRARSGGHSPAAEALLCALTEGLQVDFANALLIERRYFCQTVNAPAAKQLMRLAQQSTDLTSTAAQQLRGDLDNCYAATCQTLLEEGVSHALLKNAACGAGLPVPPALPLPTRASQLDARQLCAGRIVERLLHALASTAQQHVQKGALSANEADLISVRLFGFPAHLGGAVSFVLSKQE